MPSKKKKYNARFPAGRIKKIMQTDEEVGKVAQAVPVIISRTLELFVESLLTKTMQITLAKSAKTLSTSHIFDFLKDLVKSLPDSAACDDDCLSVGSTGLSPAAATPLISVSGPPPAISSSSSEVFTTSPTLPLQTVHHSAPCTLPNREHLISSEYNARMQPVTASVPRLCQQNSSSSGVLLPGHVNPNFYTESPSVILNHIRGNHLSRNNPSTTVTNERSSSPSSILVVDEDYDT